jgi:hypothetical protein
MSQENLEVVHDWLDARVAWLNSQRDQIDSPGSRAMRSECE